MNSDHSLDLELQTLQGISPLHFFAVTAPCYHTDSADDLRRRLKKFVLPSTEVLSGEESFASVYAGWNEEALYFFFQIHSVWTPEDSIELWIDTRPSSNMISSGWTISRFCHHFIFSLDPAKGKEVTRFRGDESHPLAISEDFDIQADLSHFKKVTILIEIPSSNLYGYHPKEISEIGFTYRINRTGLSSQFFASSSEEYKIDQHPITWGKLQLFK